MSSSWPLIGRAEELNLLKGILAEGGARGVVLSGPAGVGKTRLANEMTRYAGEVGRVTAWVAASRALAGIPFGAFAHLLPAGDLVAGSPLDVLRRAHAELRGRSQDRPLVLGVDDAHLLDEASAGLLHQLAAAGTAFVVVSVRDGEPAPESVRALWKDGIAERVELHPLTLERTGELLAAVLEGQVDSATAYRLWQASEGNVLLLRELVQTGTAQGMLTPRHGVWGWHGALSGSARLVELIDERLAGLCTERREALEVLAVGEPLPMELFERVVGPDVADSLEAAGLLGIRAGSVALAHPLYGEIVRDRLRALRRRAICRQLAGAAAAGPCDVLRLAGWQLDGGTDPDLRTLTEAAQRAGDLGDHALAARFAGVAVAEGAGIVPGLVLAESLQSQGRTAECRVQLDRLEPGRAGPIERVRWAVLAATNAFWGHGDAERADAALTEAQADLPAGDLQDRVAAHRADILAYAGRPADALLIAEPALRSTNVGEDTRVRLGRAAVLALAASGHTGRAIATADELLRGPEREGGEPSLAVDMLATARLHGYCHAGRYVELESMARLVHDRMVAGGTHDLRGVVVGMWGRALLGRGRLWSARLRLREATAALLAQDIAGFLPLMLSLLARAEVQLGDQAKAEEALGECERRTSPAIKVTHSYVSLARAWVVHGAGEHRLARAHALEAAELAAASQCHTAEVEALHEAVRLGEAGLAEHLAAAARRVDHDLARDYVAHAIALDARDGTALDACAARFAGRGLYLLAAEAGIEAAEFHAKAGRRSAEITASDLAYRWADECEGARTPVLARGRHGPVAACLTAREREIAGLATRGMSNSDIAGRLVLSPRTVGNHLSNVYDKLGVTGRAQLAARLAGTEVRPAS